MKSGARVEPTGAMPTQTGGRPDDANTFGGAQGFDGVSPNVGPTGWRLDV